MHIRQFDNNVPSKRGICLSPERFATLVYYIPDINRCVSKVRDGDKEIWNKYHLGGGIYVKIDGGFQTVNIRRYFVPKGTIEEVPTKKGIALRINEWDRLVECAEEVKSVAEELKATPCFLKADLTETLVAISCKECYPFTSFYQM